MFWQQQQSERFSQQATINESGDSCNEKKKNKILPATTFIFIYSHLCEYQYIQLSTEVVWLLLVVEIGWLSSPHLMTMMVGGFASFVRVGYIFVFMDSMPKIFKFVIEKYESSILR